jgi:hypothetical protein
VVEEVVVNGILTQEMIEAGAVFTQHSQNILAISASFWLFLPEDNIWRLMIASSEVRIKGPMRVYRQIQNILKNLPNDVPRLGLKDISVIEDNHFLISLLRSAIKVEDGPTGIRFSGNTIKGHFIQDAYIYRII